MKLCTQADCWRAILDGKTLVNEKGNKAKLSKDGKARNIQNRIDYNFVCPEYWEILEEAVMYCKFKVQIGDRVEISDFYYTVDEDDYKEFINNGWTPCTTKTFEEI